MEAAKTNLQLISSSNSSKDASEFGKLIAAIKFEKRIPKQIPVFIRMPYY